MTTTFDELWTDLWGDHTHNYTCEEKNSRNKLVHLQNGVTMGNSMIRLRDLVEAADASTNWEEPEWGFPKGRRNYMEKDYTCGLREFQEETGYHKKNMSVLHNIVPYEETFIGSNLRCYKHKYYLAYMQYESTLHTHNFQRSEVSQMRWMPFVECNQKIRPYNKEKLLMLKNVDAMLSSYVVVL
jgi:8-oxo-dGTP pyrophosphatase MutT (NUDIX family)